MGIAEDLGISLKDYGEVAVNSTSGHIYLWNEMYNFSLYMPINCELAKSAVVALWSCGECGTEEEYNLKQKDTLKDIEEAINEIEIKHNKENHK